jgi:alanyl-tRNA synthetase
MWAACLSGMFKVGDTVTMMVDEAKRLSTCKNHSCTHLLQKALRTVLGNHVEQAGSFVNADRLRFDFTHFAAMTEEEIKKTEELVNREIRANLPVNTAVMDP